MAQAFCIPSSCLFTYSIKGAANTLPFYAHQVVDWLNIEMKPYEYVACTAQSLLPPKSKSDMSYQSDPATSLLHGWGQTMNALVLPVD